VRYKKIVIKIGTSVITDENGYLDLPRIKNIVEQIAQIRKEGVDVIVVLSGAVTAGKTLFQEAKPVTSPKEKQLYASVGQISLMNYFSKQFFDKKITIGQILATKEDFRDRKHYLNMRSCFEALLGKEVIPVVNENDAISFHGATFTDNDELAGLIASMLNCDALIVLTDVDGVCDKHPKHKDAKCLTKVDPKETNVFDFITSEKSSCGTGGMFSKCKIATRLSAIGIGTHIVNGTKENIISSVMEGKLVGTEFVAQKNISSMKRWLANSQGHEVGSVFINEGAKEKLLTNGSVSLLPVGIISVEGEFEKGDIIAIKTEYNQVLGRGVAQYNSSKAGALMGKKGEKPLVRCDYLFIIE